MILHDILAYKKAELAENKKRCGLEEMINLAEHEAVAVDLSAALAGHSVKLIAEIKKASPSRGVIRRDFDPVGIAEIYAANKVAAISILTDSHFFQGSLNCMNDIRDALGSNRPPLLRKDFILDPYQVYESRLYGADSLLLIACIVTPPELEELINLSRFLHMEPLVEVHDEEDMDAALTCGAKIIGINNRDLNTFTVDLGITARLRPLVPEDRLVVSESGISTRRHIDMMRDLHVNAVLVGEAFMSTPHIEDRLRELL
ncbi:MAG: indole-3-glycerol phosphate synthase TrpC [Dehalococcoidia bacterium]|jgi:indole-3-glycerol phosphate synthase